MVLVPIKYSFWEFLKNAPVEKNSELLIILALDVNREINQGSPLYENIQKGNTTLYSRYDSVNWECQLSFGTRSQGQ